MQEFRRRGDSDPCGQSPTDFESISLAARTHCLKCAHRQQIVCRWDFGHWRLFASLEKYQWRHGSSPRVLERRACSLWRLWKLRKKERAIGNATKPCLCARKAGPVSGGHRLLALRLPHSLARLQEALKCKNFDSEGIRTPAGRAQWISSPSP